MKSSLNSKRAQQVKSYSKNKGDSEASHLFNLALQSFQKNDWSQALQHLEMLLQRSPLHFDGMHLLGIVQAQLNMVQQALNSFRQAHQINPEHLGMLSNYGLVLLGSGGESTAVDIFSKLIQAKHDLPQALVNRAKAYLALGARDLAWADALSVGQLEPLSNDVCFNLALVCFELGRLESAKAQLMALSQRGVGNGSVFNLLGRISVQEKNYDLAIDQFRVTLSNEPLQSDALLGVGIAHLMAKRFEQAIDFFGQCIRVHPTHFNAFFNRALAYKEMNLWGPAQDDLLRVIELRGDHLLAKLNLALIYKEQRSMGPAKQLLLEITQQDDLNMEANLVLAQLQKDLLNTKEAEKIYSKLQQKYPNDRFIQWSKAFLNLPAVFESQAHLGASREAFHACMRSLASDWSKDFSLLANDAPKLVGAHQPYHLAYQPVENKSILSQYGFICSELMAAWAGNFSFQKKPRESTSKIKIGIVSDQIRYHSVWNAITKGFVLNLNRDEFEVHIFSLSNTVDEETQIAMRWATQFHQRCGELIDWAQSIAAEDFDYLIYPEIGMHPLTTQLASLRLADRQLVFWGHPETTGLPTLDYFISADLFESGEADLNYSEKLVKLPNLGTHYSALPTQVQAFDLMAHLVNPSQPILICPGNLYKYAPEHDWVWMEIAKRIGPCNLVFFSKNEYWENVFKQRLERIFDQNNMDMKDFVVFLPWVNPGQFKSILSQADLYLDSLGFSGFNTAIQALECGLPVISLKGRFLRASFASGMLTKMGMQEWVAVDEEDYIKKAQDILSNPSLRAQISNQLIDNVGTLLGDMEPVRAFEDFMRFALGVNGQSNHL